MNILKWVNGIAFYSYAWFLVTAGGILGLFVPRWGPLEFEVFARAIFQADFTPEVMASALNQYRFMKSVEFGFGVFALLFRKEIYTVPKFNRFFLGIVFLGAAMRVLSMLIDGRPHVAYIFFAGLEFTIGAVIFAYSRTTLRNS